jgi:hypothetical protein
VPARAPRYFPEQYSSLILLFMTVLTLPSETLSLTVIPLFLADEINKNGGREEKSALVDI